MPVSRRLLMKMLLATMFPTFTHRRRVLQAYWLFGAGGQLSLAGAQRFESYPAILLAEVAAQSGEGWVKLDERANPFSVASFQTHQRDSVWVMNPRDIWMNKPRIEPVDPRASRLELYFYKWWQHNADAGAYRKPYFYLRARKAEVERLLENPQGIQPVRRTAWPDEEDLTFLRLLLPELED